MKCLICNSRKCKCGLSSVEISNKVNKKKPKPKSLDDLFDELVKTPTSKKELEVSPEIFREMRAKDVITISGEDFWWCGRKLKIINTKLERDKISD